MGYPDIFAVGPDGMPTDGTVFPSADYHAADPAPAEFATLGAEALTLNIVVTAISGAGCTLTVTIQGYDPASATWIDYLVSAAIIATGTTQLYVSHHMAASANVAAQKPLARKMRVKPVKSGTNTTLTYSIGAVLT